MDGTNLKTFITVLVLIMIYWIISIFINVPMPEFYRKMQRDNLEEVRKSDPLLKEINYIMQLNKTNDSLRHVINEIKNKP